MKKPQSQVLRERALTAKELRKAFHYDPETGVFTRLIAVKNGPAGSIAGTLMEGYLRIMVNKTRYAAHRLAWLYVYGAWPEKNLDHANRNRADNRIRNLREATQSQNVVNGNLRANNKSGVRGVRFHKASGKWSVKIAGRWLGVYEDKDRAATVAAESYRKMFGEFAPTAAQ